MGPWLATTIRACDKLVDSLAYWTFSDVFEEQGVVRQPLCGGFGLIGAYSPSLLSTPSRCSTRLETAESPSTRTPSASERVEGSLAIAVWNYFPPGQPGPARQVTLELRGLRGARMSLAGKIRLLQLVAGFLPRTRNACPASDQARNAKLHQSAKRCASTETSLA